ncbi:capsid assembly scaffolding protein Gp46 family protein [Clostridium beijerinckii]|uniref:capsid assembly scaffolding protein Gp46 family protein n=1 Tax=Clostridium beijerinckii TaxID=1520 RepID=UPI0014948E0B|nr:DUF4355 domain-containing protein [Clostridium beijerinckii]NOW03226.1 hypothetical protein [Clostridium beijerinckii]NYC03632.1 hypothetical protein [Clostridium beijerinckii]
MLKNELLEKLKDIADDAIIDETIQGIEGFAKPFDVKSLGLDDFKNVLESNDIAKSYFQSALDSGVGKGVAKYKENFSKNELPKLIEDGIKAKSNDGKTEDQIKLEQVLAEMEQMKAEKAKTELSSELMKELSSKGLSNDWVDFIIADNKENSIARLEKLNGILSATTEEKVKQKLGDFTYDAKKTDTNSNNGITLEKFKKMPYKERLELNNTNKQLYTELQQQLSNNQ